jgi:acyl carrier protein
MDSVEHKSKLRLIISERTGFPIEMINGNLKLLDDLNIDSIKIMEIVVEVSNKTGITLTLEDLFNNSTINDIEKVLNNKIGNK